LRAYLSLAAHRTLLLLALVLVFPSLISGPTATAQTSVSIPEEIEWTWEVRPAHPDPNLPNVLLLGDNPEGYVLTHKNYGFTNSPLKVNVPRPVPPPSKGFPWSGNVVSVSVPVARSWSGSKLIV
jgi:hypothetical protein